MTDPARAEGEDVATRLATQIWDEWEHDRDSIIEAISQALRASEQSLSDLSARYEAVCKEKDDAWKDVRAYMSIGAELMTRAETAEAALATLRDERDVALSDLSVALTDLDTEHRSLATLRDALRKAQRCIEDTAAMPVDTSWISALLSPSGNGEGTA